MTSPMWPLTRTVTERQLGALERYFDGHPKRNAYDDPRKCYFNILAGRHGHAVRPVASAAKKAGWLRQDKGTLNVWTKPSKLVLPPGYSVRFGRMGGSPVHKDFLALTRQNFKRGAAFMRELSAMFRAIAPNTIEVVIYGRSGRRAAAGLVTTCGQGAYFFCGSVAPRYRGKRLWYALVAARQWVSYAEGTRFWVTSTFNPRIAGKADSSFKVVTFYKDAPKR